MLRACLVASLVVLGVPDQSSGETKGQRARTVAEIQRAVLTTVVQKHCQQQLCLVAVRGEPLDEDLLRALTEFGQVAAPLPGDLELDGSGMSGATRSRGARVVDLAKVIVAKNGEAVAYVNMYETVIDATMCRLRIRREEGKWRVDDEATACTM
jgi:hypothetical protein